MKDDETYLCEWEHCSGLREKHVHFGHRAFDIVDAVHIPRSPDSIEHRDLCQMHVDLTLQHYMDVSVHRLETCPGIGVRV